MDDVMSSIESQNCYQERAPESHPELASKYIDSPKINALPSLVLGQHPFVTKGEAIMTACRVARRAVHILTS